MPSLTVDVVATVDASYVAQLAANLISGEGEQPADPQVTKSDASNGRATLTVTAGEVELAKCAGYAEGSLTPFEITHQGKIWRVSEEES